MHKRWWMGGAAVAVVVAAVAAWAVSRGDGGAPAARADKDVKPALQFSAREVAQPAYVQLPLTLEFSGPLVAPSTAIVRAKGGGTLLSLQADEGARVRAGQRIGTLDLADLSARLAERQAMVESSRALLVQAERTHQSNQQLASQQFISANALDNSRAAYDSARAQLAAATAQLDTIRVGMRDAALVAPISGIVAKRHAVPGEKLAVEQEVVTIVDLTRLELAGHVGTHEVSLLAPGMPVSVKVEGLADPVVARIARIAPAAETGTRSIGVTIALDNPQEKLRAGQYAVARVVLADPTPRLAIPTHAIGSTSGQEHVWVVENGVLARRAVTTGRRDAQSGNVEVLQGLKPGAQVLAARFDNLREGAKATVVAAATPVASTASAVVR